jgi:hypothetical protein
MTAEEFAGKEKPLLEELPLELRSAVSYMAYESGHSAGYDEVLNELKGLVGDLNEPLKAFEARIRAEYTTNTAIKIEEQWKARAIVMGYKPKSATYKKMQCEFFVGAISAINSADEKATGGALSENVPPYWVLAIMSGREVCK